MKDKNGKIVINDNKKYKIIGAFSILILMIILIIIIIRTTVKNKITKDVAIIKEDYSFKNEIEWFDEEYENNINLEEIMQKNISENDLKKVIETKTEVLEYETEYQNNSSIPKGIVQVLQQGEEGKQELIICKEYKGEELIKDEQIGRKILYPTINRIVEVGTGNYYKISNIKEGDIVYSTPYELSIRLEASKEAEVVIKIDQSSKLTIISKKGNWYYVKSGTYYGWVENDCVTNIEPDINLSAEEVPETYSKQKLLKTLSKDMKLNKASGLTLEQFEKIFENESKDVNGIFKENAKYFYYIENEYGINGIFVAAIGIHESAWGTSKIATEKKNLFGYGAYDMNAYSSAYSYNGYAAGIDMIARVLVKNYLNPKGTSIYNGEVATGKYYNGNTLTAVNKKYATDKNWSDGVYTWMKYLYNKV